MKRDQTLDPQKPQTKSAGRAIHSFAFSEGDGAGCLTKLELTRNAWAFGDAILPRIGSPGRVDSN